ncbi:MAG: methyltransferase family protein [Planctomycetota bacterium]
MVEAIKKEKKEKIKLAVKNIWGNVLFYTLYLGAIPFAVYFLHNDFEKFIRFSLKIPTLPIIGYFAIIFGLVLNVITLYFLWKKGKGTNAITEQSKLLVAEGPLKVVRNPCHLGVIICIIGYAIISGSVLYLVYALLYFIGVDIYLRLYEEKLLEKKFGIQYVVYKQSVPKWLPFRIFKKGSK